MKTPTLIYDGDCEFCQYCVNYLTLKTGSKVDYLAYQKDSKGLPLEKCARTIHLIVDPQEIYTGAAAGFKVLAFGGAQWGWWSYQHLPGIAWVSEKIYWWITQHRSFCFKIAKTLCGNPWQLWRLPFTLLSITTITVLVIILLGAILN